MTNIIEVSCEIVGKNAVATVNNVTWLAGGGGYSFTINKVQNPFSV